MALCRYWANGNCLNGDKCPYQHVGAPGGGAGGATGAPAKTITKSASVEISAPKNNETSASTVAKGGIVVSAPPGREDALARLAAVTEPVTKKEVTASAPEFIPRPPSAAPPAPAPAPAPAPKKVVKPGGAQWVLTPAARLGGAPVEAVAAASSFSPTSAASTPEFVPSSGVAAGFTYEGSTLAPGARPFVPSGAGSGPPGFGGPGSMAVGPGVPSRSRTTSPPPAFGPVVEQRGGTTYFLPEGADPNLHPFIPMPANLYTTPLPHVVELKSNERTVSQTAMSEELRQELLARNSLILACTDPEDPFFALVPRIVGRYHTLYPLDSPTRDKASTIFGLPTSAYKAISANDGLPYCIRRIEGYRLTNEFAIHFVDNWKKIRHPSIVSLREAWTSKDFGDRSLCFVYDYHPGATTLEQSYFLQPRTTLIPEPLLWSYVTQLLGGLRIIHGAGLACRVIDASKVLLTSRHRVRISCAGVFDVVQYDGGKNVEMLKQEDLFSLGKLLLALACGNPNAGAAPNVRKGLDSLAMNYSVDMKNLAMVLLSKPNNPHYPGVDEICGMVMPHIMDEMQNTQSSYDVMEGELGKELDNGRLFRLAAKLGMIVERPEHDMDDPAWAETGDRYLLKLFRDYVFHQVNSKGAPVIDYGHVVDCLNKLDAGSDESICLMSRDEQSVLVVRYRDLRRCVEEAFRDLRTASTRTSAKPPMGGTGRPFYPR